MYQAYLVQFYGRVGSNNRTHQRLAKRGKNPMFAADGEKKKERKKEKGKGGERRRKRKREGKRKGVSLLVLPFPVNVGAQESATNY